MRLVEQLDLPEMRHREQLDLLEKQLAEQLDWRKMLSVVWQTRSENSHLPMFLWIVVVREHTEVQEAVEAQV